MVEIASAPPRNDKTNKSSFERGIWFKNKACSFDSSGGVLLYVEHWAGLRNAVIGANNRSTAFSGQKRRSPVQDAVFLVWNAPFLTGNAPFLIRNATFLTGNASFLVRNATFLTGNAPFLIRNATFLTGNAAFLIGNVPFLVGNAAFVI